MNGIMTSICFLSLFIISSCSTTDVDIYKPCREQVEAINKMHLYRTYLVPVDSLGKYVYEETIFPEMYDHCELIADKEHKKVCILATIYFDIDGRVRKSIQHWADGGNLNNVTYYDEQGTIVYAIYVNGENDYGRLYSLKSKIYIEHSFSGYSLDNTFLSTISMTTKNLATAGKVNLQIPDECKSISFEPIQKGRFAFLCANNVYTAPNGSVVKKEDENMLQACFGRMVYIDSVVNGWCRLKVPTFDKPMGYAPMDSLELYVE